MYFTEAHLSNSRQAMEFLSAGKHSSDSPCALGHHLVWTLFDSGERDFLWRSDGRTFWILSERHPSPARGVLSCSASKEFPECLPAGARLRFSLRANAKVCVNGKRHDVVMHWLRKAEHGRNIQRSSGRRRAIQEGGWEWLSKQAALNGFMVSRDALRIDGYQMHSVIRRGGSVMRFSTLDFDGLCKIEDADRFMSAVKRGLGGAKGFGNGLMLLAPA